MQQRYYDPVIGRFYSNDPVGFSADNPMMFNRYAYGNNNPYKYVDPDGRAGVLFTAAKEFAKNELKKDAKEGLADKAKNEIKQDLKEKPQNLNLTPGQGQTLNPKSLSTDKIALEKPRLDTQKGLQKTGESKPIKVDQTGNIIDGNHRARAAAESGTDIKADVVEMPNATPGSSFVTDLPVKGG